MIPKNLFSASDSPLHFSGNSDKEYVYYKEQDLPKPGFKPLIFQLMRYQVGLYQHLKQKLMLQIMYKINKSLE